jgi:hypothetical protein
MPRNVLSVDPVGSCTGTPPFGVKYWDGVESYALEDSVKSRMLSLQF